MNWARCLILLLALTLFGIEEASAATVKGIAFDTKQGGIRLEMQGSAQLKFQLIDSPTRLLIDLPASSWTGGTRSVKSHDPRIKALRLGQYSIFPAIVRVVVELADGQAVAPLVKKTPRGIVIALTGGQPLASGDKPIEQIEKPKPVVKTTPKPIMKPKAKAPVAPKKPTPKKVETPKPIATPAPATPVMAPVKAKPTPAIPTLREEEIPSLPPLPENTPKPLSFSPTPTPEPTPVVEATPVVVAKETKETPKPENSEDGNPSASSFQVVWQQLDIGEAYPISANGSYTTGTTYGVLTDYRGIDWKHWFSPMLGFQLEGKLSSFKLFDNAQQKQSDRTDTVAHPSLLLRMPLGAFQPEASLGFLYRTTQVKANSEIQDATAYPTNANMSIMAPSFGAGLRWQLIEPLALVANGSMTNFGSSSLNYAKQENLSTMLPLSQSRLTLQAVLDFSPFQFALGSYLETISGKGNTALEMPAYKQTDNGITFGMGFSY